MAADVTITADNCGWGTTAGELSGIVSGVTVAVSNGVTGTTSAEGSTMRVYKDATLTISASENITKIVFNCVANNTTKYGPGCFGAQEGYSYDAKVGTWEGNATSVSFTASSAQVRATSIVVTLAEGGETPGEELFPHAVTWDTPLNLDAAKFANAKAGDKIVVTYESATDGIEFKVLNTTFDHMAGSREALDLDQAEGTHTLEQFLTANAVDSIKAHGLQIIGNHFTVTNVELQDGKTPKEGITVWTGFFWADSWSTLELYKEGYNYVDFSNVEAVRFYTEAIGTDYVVNFLKGWGEGEKFADQTNMTDGEGYKELALTDELRTALAEAGHWMVQFNKESLEAFNVTDVVLVEKEPVVETINCAAVYSLEKNAEVALNQVTVTYANGKNVFVKDESGAMLIYFTANTDYAAGDVLSGVTGTLDIYNGLYEVKPTAAQAEAIVANPGTVVPAPEELTAVPTAADMNKYVLLKGITFATTDFVSKNITATMGEETFVLRNNFNLTQSFDTEKTYDIVGAVAIYNGTIQVYLISATEVEGETPVEPQPVAEWAEIKFTEVVAAADLAENASFAVEGSEFSATITDTGDKMSIDANPCRFGTADAYVSYSHRLKSGGKSSSSTNFITFNIPADGKLRIAVRTGSNSATDRNLVLAQGTDTLFNQIILESSAIKVMEGENEVSVYPYVIVDVKAGSLVASYPVNGVNFYSFAFKEGAEEPVVETPHYNVAEAIAAGLKEDDEVYVRGIITKMEFKGKNFAKYGSVNIYVADATGAEGEFEFYNCYSLNADTFRTSTPDYDETSTAWAQFREVVDGNGNAIHVGDTVEAFGKYKLFNATHELNTGCYLVDVKAAPVEPGETIELAFTDGGVDNRYYATYGSTDIQLYNIPVVGGQLQGDGDFLQLEVYPADPNDISGEYSIEDEGLDDYYTYLMRVNGTDTTEIEFVSGSITVSVQNANKETSSADLTVQGQLMTAEGDVYVINSTLNVYYSFTISVDEKYKFDEAEAEFNYNFDTYQLLPTGSDVVVGVMAQTDEAMIAAMIVLPEGQTELVAGEYEVSVLPMYGTVMAGQYTADGPQPSYAMMSAGKLWYFVSGKVTVEGDGSIVIDALNSNGKAIKSTLNHLQGEGIDEVNAAVKATKTLKNGQLIIEKAGVKYNAQGAVIR